jgi:DNA (cytosine-5)-methyltransferase 1
MADIAALPWNGFNVVSTFSGCGGSSLGYRIAGFRVLWANEFIEAARDTYKANAAPYTIVDGRDIRTVQPESILAATGLRPGELDLLDGSPPCCSFSMAGKRAKGWGEQRAYSDGVQQRTDDLFFQYTRLLRGLRPKCFVAENVAGLVRGVAKGYFLDILKELKACSYRVAARVLDGQWLGVPQARQRLIFVGVRDDLGLEPAHPKPLPYRYTLRDVLVPGGPAEPDTDISRFAIGREWDRMGKPGTQSEKYFQLVRPALDASCPTVTATTGQPGAAGVCHPTERRKFSIAELRRICSFPHDFVLTGTYQQQVERMGRAVPPIMMAAIAAAVRDNVLRRINP